MSQATQPRSSTPSPASQAASQSTYTQPPGFFKRLNAIDWLYGAA